MYGDNGDGAPIEILLVEDNPADAELTIETLQDSKVHNNIHVAEDGVEALEFLRREGENADKPRPDLILLDLNLPRKDGREVLEEIKNNEDLMTIPPERIMSAKVDYTIVGGKIVYKRDGAK